MQVNQAGVWKNATPYCNVGGTWVKPKEVWVKDAGVWKKEWSDVRTLLDSTLLLKPGEVGYYEIATIGGNEQYKLNPDRFEAPETGFTVVLFEIAPGSGAYLNFYCTTPSSNGGAMPSDGMSTWIQNNVAGIEIEGVYYPRVGPVIYDSKMWWHSFPVGLPVDALSRHGTKNMIIRLIGT